MASFFSNSENERDTSALLPNSYSEGLLSGNMMMYMNNYSSSSAGLYSSALPVNTDSNHSHQEIMSQIGTSQIEGNVLNEWKDSRSNLMLMHQLENAAAVNGGVFHGTQNLQGQGLSLTLGPHVPSGFHMSSFQNQSSEPGFSSIMCANQSLDVVHSSTTNQESKGFEYMPHGVVPDNNLDLMRTDVSPYGISSGTRSVPNPKYLKAAQELLDEVVNVKTALKEQNSKGRLMKDSKENDGKSHIGGLDPTGSTSEPKQQESSSNSPAELSASEKQELQNKLTKLFEMLDEVDRRYKQYYHQMQIVVSSFDIIAGGSGASKPYTALALQTISRHFRCLRDAISEQIQTARKGLGDQDTLANNKGIGISRLRYIDQHIRQGRGGIQQLGMMQQHAWRPQRGLPESSVSILRAWLFEHFLHPYPKDSDKIMLARQTGLSRSQVSNWFINARVRLWKPMVEEMYKEELGDVEMDANSPSEFAAKASSSDAKAPEDIGDCLQQSTTTSTCAKHPSNLTVFDPQSSHLSNTQWTDSRIGNTVQEVTLMETENAYRLGKSRAMNDCNNMLLLPDSTFVQSNESSDNNNRLMAAAYHISELGGRFENGGNGVSLTLGLQQCEGGNNVPMSIEAHQSYGTMRNDGMYSTTAPSVEAGEYDCLDSGNRNHRFSSSQLLHDFVA